jgi:hypothetical protein
MTTYHEALENVVSEAYDKQIQLHQARETIDRYNRLAYALNEENARCRTIVCAQRDGVAVFIASDSDRSVVAELSHAVWKFQRKHEPTGKWEYHVTLPTEPDYPYEVWLRAQLDEVYLAGVRERDAALNPQGAAA